MKKTVLVIYLVTSMVVCGWFTMAAALGWKAPDFGISKSMSSGGSRSGYYGGRSYGGSWGGGK